VRCAPGRNRSIIGFVEGSIAGIAACLHQGLSFGWARPWDVPRDNAAPTTRCLDAEALRNAIASLEIIEAYPDDKYLPSFLLRGETKGAVFHAQIATDVEGDNIRVVTMYTPDADEWDEEFRKRRTK
jgi:hypothetical protein